MLLIQWQAQPEQFDLVVVNLVPHRGQGYAPLTIPDLADHHWSMRDLLGTEDDPVAYDELVAGAARVPSRAPPSA